MGGTDQVRDTRRSPATTNGGDTWQNREGAPKNLASDAIINLDHGDPTMYEPFWRSIGDKCTVVFKGYESLSYFSNPKNPCWFLEPKLEESIKSLHGAVGNAVTDGYSIVVGTGSSQLLQAVLYAVTSHDQANPINVVSASPYYSSYPEIMDLVKSGLYKWGGDAHAFDKDEPYVELVTSPNNPNGVIRGAVVNHEGGILVHDLAYYWPQYTPITSSLESDIMLFTASKCTGHAGSRIGWALVKDKEVAKKMIKYMEVTTIGVSKESQLRVAKILQVVADGCKRFGSPDGDNFFEFGQKMMAKSNAITLDMSLKHIQLLHGLNARKELTVRSLLSVSKSLTRGGSRFGSDPAFVRVSMMSKDEEFNLFIDRLSMIQSFNDGNGNETGNANGNGNANLN
ncbi:L-tryptophan--pyruvate aminotransferase 1-like protein [Tanacetum coccineum]